jgi:hypothetical protein
MSKAELAFKESTSVAEGLGEWSGVSGVVEVVSNNIVTRCLVKRGEVEMERRRRRRNKPTVSPLHIS